MHALMPWRFAPLHWGLFKQSIPIEQAEAKTLKEQAESVASAAEDHPKANDRSAAGEPVEPAQAVEAAATAAAQAALEAEAKSLKEELQGAREALEASEASRTIAENLLAETKQVCVLCVCMCVLGIPWYFVP